LHKLVVMGVAGAGKSTLARELARVLGATLVEGDEHHLAASKAKMRAGIPLDDADREPWLDLLGDRVAAAGSVVLTCSALKRIYRDRLRAKVAALKFVFIDIDRDEAEKRVAERPSHLFPASLVASQFMALEPPLDEPGVVRVSARATLDEQVNAVAAWLASPGAA
jgi:gluconokinase